jgi:hypothetical protein
MLLTQFPDRSALRPALGDNRIDDDALLIAAARSSSSAWRNPAPARGVASSNST